MLLPPIFLRCQIRLLILLPLRAAAAAADVYADAAAMPICCNVAMLLILRYCHYVFRHTFFFDDTLPLSPLLLSLLFADAAAAAAFASFAYAFRHAAIIFAAAAVLRYMPCFHASRCCC